MASFALNVFATWNWLEFCGGYIFVWEFTTEFKFFAFFVLAYLLSLLLVRLYDRVFAAHYC